MTEFTVTCAGGYSSDELLLEVVLISIAWGQMIKHYSSDDFSNTPERIHGVT